MSFRLGITEEARTVQESDSQTCSVRVVRDAAGRSPQVGHVCAAEPVPDAQPPVVADGDELQSGRVGVQTPDLTSAVTLVETRESHLRERSVRKK